MSQPFGQILEPGPIDLGLPVPIRVFDIEVWPNFAMCGVWSEDHTFRVFTSEPGIGEPLSALAELAAIPALWVGFNNLSYDNHMVEAMVEGEHDPAALKARSDALINPNSRGRNYCYGFGNAVTCDLFAIHKGIFGNLGGLKWVAHKMDYPFTREAPFPFELQLTPAQMVQVCAEYNRHDVGVTLWMLHAMQEALRIRLLLEAEHGISVINTPDSKLAEAILQQRLFGAVLPKTAWVPRNQRRWLITGSEITQHYDFVAPELIAAKATISGWLLEYNEEEIEKDAGTERKINNPRKRYEFHYAGLTIRNGLGGLHSIDPPMTFEADPQFTLIDYDISAFYPYLIATNDWRPRHLPVEFNAVFEALIESREQAVAEGNELRATAYKIANNSIFGKSKSPYSWLCDPTLTASVCLAGQMIILQAIELCYGLGDGVSVQPIMANTDGWTLRVRRDLVGLVRQRVEAFVDIYGLKIKEVEYTRLIRRDGNNYLALTSAGKAKAKGAFGYDRGNLGKMNTERVVIDAVRETFLHDTPLATTIAACADLRDFLCYFKASKGWRLTSADALQRHGTMARWYHQQDGVNDLYKLKEGAERPVKVAGAVGVRLMPDLPLAGPPGALAEGCAVPVDLDRAIYVAKAERLVLSVTEPDKRRQDTLALADLGAAQMARFQANAACGEADVAKCQRLDLSRFVERYSEKRRGNSYDSMKSVLFGVWAQFAGELTRGDLLWCAEQISEQGDDYFASGKKHQDLVNMVEYYAYEVAPFAKPKSISECLSQALAIVQTPGKIEVAKRKRTMYHRSLVDSTFLTGTTLGKYDRSRDLFKVAYALCAACVKYRIEPDVPFLTGILAEVQNYYG